jgi:hypothetical protein
MSIRLALCGLVIQAAAAMTLAGCAQRSGLSAVPTPTADAAIAIFRQRLAADPSAGWAADAATLAAECAAGMAIRDRVLELAARCAARRASGAPVTGEDLDQLFATLREGLDRSARIFAIAAIHDGWLDTDQPVSDDHRRGTVLSLAASLTLYEGWLATAALLDADDGLRRRLQLGDPGHGVPPDVLHRLADDALDTGHRRHVRAKIAWCDRERAGLTRLAEAEPAVRWCCLRVLGSPALALMGTGPLGELWQRVTVAERRTRDDALRLAADAVGGLSQLFGNAVGAVQVRHGRLHGDASAAARIRAVLEPGDILVEKTPFRLTDKLIPGYWGHVAVWVGDADQVRALGLWDDPLVVPHRERLAAGAGVCEALRDGVTLNTLAHFLDVDAVAVLRPTAGDRLAHLRGCLRQLGKAYDFNFDVETSDRIVCSELVYAACTDLPWPTERALGRHTISPDAVARQALPGGCLRTVALWVDGRPDSAERMAELLEQP